MDRVQRVNGILQCLCLFGALVSCYALYVEVRASHSESFTPMCDISEEMKCSRVLTSRWGRGFGILGSIFGEDSILNQPNSLSGIVFYGIIAVLSTSNTQLASKGLLYLAGLSNLMTVYLAYILAFVLHDLCVVCVTIYCVNALILAAVLRKLHLVNRLKND